MNVVDAAILAVIGLFAVGGMRRGFLLGLVDLVGFGLSIVVAARLAGSIAEPLRQRGIPAELAAGAGFVIVAVISLAVIGFAARMLLAPLGAIGAGSPLSWANGVLGLLPGAIRGLAVAALLVLLLDALPSELGLRQSLHDARLAQPIADTGLKAMDTGLGWAGIDLQTLGTPFAGSTSRLADSP